MKSPMFYTVILLLLLGIASRHSAADDWAVYRGDCGRSGYSADPLKFPLKLSWTHRSAHRPRPAWPAPAKSDLVHAIQPAPAMARSPAYYTVISGGLVYFGSSSDDTIYCLDAKTGKTRWSFVTEGPVRLAPAVAGGRLYAGSDDGLVYCLDARTGAEVWRYRAGPEDKRLPGNERMISLWPVRCGVIVDEGRVYFSAGVFPAWGVYLCALDARSGTEIWKEDIRVAAQGHLVASPDRLFVATGRTAPHLYERSTGKHVRNLRGGGSFGVLTGHLYAHGGGEKSRSLYLTNAKSGARIMSSPGTRLAANETILCVLNGNNLTVYDRAQYIGERKAKAKWTIRCSSTVELILAGNAVLVGGENKVSACSAADGKTVWTVGVVYTQYYIV